MNHLNLSLKALKSGMEWTGPFMLWHFIRIRAGAAYWLESAGSRDLNVGSVLLIPPGARGSLRVSQLSELVLEWFTIQPEVLLGLLTIVEEQFLYPHNSPERRKVLVFDSTHAVAQKFSLVSSGGDNLNPLLRRCLMLEVLALAFDKEWPNQASDTRPRATAGSRLAELVSQQPGGVLLNIPADELARRCGCSKRHFLRLFRTYCGKTIKEKQIELRR